MSYYGSSAYYQGYGYNFSSPSVNVGTVYSGMGIMGGGYGGYGYW